MTWVKTQDVFINKPFDTSHDSCPSLGVSHGAGQLDADLHRDSPLNITTKLVFVLQIQELLSQKQNLCVGKSSRTFIFTTDCLCSNILHCEHGVSFLLSPSRIHVLAHPCKEMLLLWIRDDVTIVDIDFEWQNVTQTNQRRYMRLTSWLTSRINRVSMIFLREYDLTCPGPSQGLSQVSSQDCEWIRPLAPYVGTHLQLVLWQEHLSSRHYIVVPREPYCIHLPATRLLV